MKRRLVKGLRFLIIGLSISWISGCNSGSGNDTEEKLAFDQEAFNNQIQGVYKYLPPNQGLATNLNNHFIFIFGDSDTTMVCQAGTYTTTEDTVIYTTRYASDPELVGTRIKWSPRFLDSDSVKTILFDDDGNITTEFFNNQKVKIDDKIRSQMKNWEGVYMYPSSDAMGIAVGGYILYGGQFGSATSGTAATYEYNEDTVKVKRLFALDPEKKGEELRWLNESMNGDTLNWATINDAGEIMSRGQSVYLK